MKEVLEITIDGWRKYQPVDQSGQGVTRLSASPEPSFHDSETAATRLQLPTPLGEDSDSFIGLSNPMCESSSQWRLRENARIGPFLLHRLIGQGAQGDVWKATRCGAPYNLIALKILKPSLSKDPKRLAQFRHEAERGAKLTGPSLLRVIEFGEADGHTYLAMPLVEGTSLMNIIRERREFLAGERPEHDHPMIAADTETYPTMAARVVAIAARAIEGVHARRIVHRDIKPANILIDARRANKVYLCDLGLGRDLEIATIEQMRDGAGTPLYMAPERLLRSQVDEIRCDVYALGVTLFESLALERPFQIPNGMAAILVPHYLTTVHPRRLRQVMPNAPRALDAVIAKAMAHDPAHRHSSALELAEEIEHYLYSRVRTNIATRADLGSTIPKTKSRDGMLNRPKV